MKPRPYSLLAWSLVIAAAAVGAWLVFRPAAVPCDFADVDRGEIVVTVDEDGRTRLKDRYIVSAPLEGRIDRIVLRPGDPVIKGVTRLARIAPTDPTLLDERSRAEAQARVSAAEAVVSRSEVELARAGAELEHAQEEYARVRAAAEVGAVTPQETADEASIVRITEHSRDAARFSLEMTKFELEQARAVLLHETGRPSAPGDQDIVVFDVPSPIDGRVLRVLHESAGVVSPGEPLLELGSLEQLEVEVDVLSDQAVRVRPGQRVVLERWGGEQPLAGIVRVVEPSGYMKTSALGVEEQRVNVIIEFMDGPDARPTLGDNFRVEARIVVSEAAGVLRVPLGALVRNHGEWAAYAVESGRARLRPLVLGQRSDRFAEVAGGLDEGSRVIVFPGDRVADGVRVSSREAHR